MGRLREITDGQMEELKRAFAAAGLSAEQAKRILNLTHTDNYRVLQAMTNFVASLEVRDRKEQPVDLSNFPSFGPEAWDGLVKPELYQSIRADFPWTRSVLTMDDEFTRIYPSKLAERHILIYVPQIKDLSIEFSGSDREYWELLADFFYRKFDINAASLSFDCVAERGWRMLTATPIPSEEDQPKRGELRYPLCYTECKGSVAVLGLMAALVTRTELSEGTMTLRSAYRVVSDGFVEVDPIAKNFCTQQNPDNLTSHYRVLERRHPQICQSPNPLTLSTR